MDALQFIVELVRALAWPCAVVTAAYFVKQAVDAAATDSKVVQASQQIEQANKLLREANDKLDGGAIEASPTYPRVQVRPAPSPRPDASPTSR